MKTTDDMLAEMRAALAHHEAEAAKLRAGIAALTGETPIVAVGNQARPAPQHPSTPPLPYVEHRVLPSGGFA